MLHTTLPPDLPPFSDTAAASTRRQLTARRLCEFGIHATGRLEAGRLRPVAAPFLPLESYSGLRRMGVASRGRMQSSGRRTSSWHLPRVTATHEVPRSSVAYLL